MMMSKRRNSDGTKRPKKSERGKSKKLKEPERVWTKISAAKPRKSERIPYPEHLIPFNTTEEILAAMNKKQPPVEEPSS